MKTFLIFFLFFGIILISVGQASAIIKLENEDCPAGTQPFNHAGGGTTCEPIPPALPQTGGQQQPSGQQPSQQQKTQTTNVGIEIPNPLFTSDLVSLIDRIATWLLGIGSTIAVIVVLWAAFLFMTSGGSKDQVTRARQTLWYAVIGLTVLLLAKGVTLFIQNVLSGRFY